ncbi:MAG: SAM-dependent methyltransferase [Gammaproteobacteria bacterium]|uniref:SAM-dependent methyltransferase n=1 Tax=OM182 bacterium MED-G24 TaxID=1986255 RepID=A0A2A5WQS0_9GAMM|nr:SAM-dependent methyltransferase [Gammaproteobacteria bacterium]PDH38633.1 MAG: SAM-dependent methyltransferase [OM182 bacterium MED-G24]|tara:strand:+ start:2308 stop:3021 length:714 start_codon:yes stop_codon:yes gene_type:complete
MQLKGPETQPVQNETEVITRMLPLAAATILELGCGGAEKTRWIAENTDVAQIVAAEVDEQQHAKNLKVIDLPKVRFCAYGAEGIDESDASFDAVLMFKSLHHVPVGLMEKAFSEIHRVLKPGGWLYVSEPVFAGAFNEIMRLFHDEEHVRQQAFNAIERAVGQGNFDLTEEYFFKNEIKMQSWEHYERNILGVTHTNHNLSDDLVETVKSRFLAARNDAGFVFEIPNRVDLLRRQEA